ncbi:hypothetical protein LA080_002892 [Diaporthe eres]|uniref:Uncharacterized protein n=1 Tax=Diaporthe vaccinii TaxID=105482 RepID=A0ABR4EVS2_9PEZI|nr:hypothetical protein LA080_002892 [Diaporthe eres]
MEHTDGTPSRRRTKRRNETHECDSTRSETDRSAARRRRIRRGDDEGKANKEDSDAESDDEDEAKSTTGSSSTIASTPTAPPPGTATLSPPPPPPPVATPPSATLDSQTLPPASTTPDAQTIISATPSTTVGTQTLSQSATNTPVAAAETTDPPRAHNGAGLNRQSPAAPPVATTVIAVFGSLAGVSLLAFLFWKLYRRGRGRDEPDQSSGKEIFVSGPKSDIRIMDEAMAAAYKAEGGNNSTIGFIPPRDGDPSRDGTADQGVSRWSDSTPGWLSRQVQKVKSRTSPDAAAAEDGSSSPKDAAVSRWMDRHASRMLDPMAARASVASSGAASLRGLGPVPSVSPASVVGDQRESILSEMGQIRRAAVPPPLDPKLVARVRQMQEEDQMRQQERTRGAPAGGDFDGGVLRPPPPVADRWGNSSPTVMSPARTETTWNTWGVEQRRK